MNGEFKLGYKGPQYDDFGKIKEYTIIGKNQEF